MIGKAFFVVSLILLVAMLVVGSAGIGSGQEEDAGFVVVVNKDNPVSSLSSKEVSRQFLKRIEQWIDGRPIEPVDLPAESPVRKAFSRAVHGKSADAVAAYWRHQIFAGVGTPPVQKESEEEVLDLIRRNVNAIGYVSNTTALGSSVKVLTISINS